MKIEILEKKADLVELIVREFENNPDDPKYFSDRLFLKKIQLALEKSSYVVHIRFMTLSDCVHSGSF
jgi:hypothetical protein